MAETILDSDEPDPVTFDNEAGRSVFFLTCDHAGRAIPRRLDRLGLPDHETRRHIAWDIGIGGVGRRLSQLLDATVILQTYSRLVIDCNRDPKVPSSIPEISETTEIPGNLGLTEAARTARTNAIFRPYHDTIAAALDRLAASETIAGWFGPTHFDAYLRFKRVEAEKMAGLSHPELCARYAEVY